MQRTRRAQRKNMVAMDTLASTVGIAAIMPSQSSKLAVSTDNDGDRRSVGAIRRHERICDKSRLSVLVSTHMEPTPA